MAQDPLIGTELGGYRIEAAIARGAMGVVYRAEQRAPRRRVALKVVAPELAMDPEFRRRFLREEEIAAALDHPNVLPVHDAGGGVSAALSAAPARRRGSEPAASSVVAPGGTPTGGRTRRTGCTRS